MDQAARMVLLRMMPTLDDVNIIIVQRSAKLVVCRSLARTPSAAKVAKL
jgi:hypothetical protein